VNAVNTNQLETNKRIYGQQAENPGTRTTASQWTAADSKTGPKNCRSGNMVLEPGPMGLLAVPPDRVRQTARNSAVTGTIPCTACEHKANPSINRTGIAG